MEDIQDWFKKTFSSSSLNQSDQSMNTAAVQDWRTRIPPSLTYEKIEKEIQEKVSKETPIQRVKELFSHE